MDLTVPGTAPGPRGVPGRFARRAAGNALLVVASICFSLLVVELALRLFAPSLPLGPSKLLHEDVQLLAQSSKRGVLPRNYIAILGDSYAAGQGSWYDQAVRQHPFGRPPFQAAHVIHDMTGRDVVTFGEPGAGSFDGWVYRPVSRFEMLRTRGYAIEEPSQVVAYVYEGNDFRDNIQFLSRHWESDKAYTTENMAALIEKTFALGPRVDGGLAAQLVDRLKNAALLRRLYVTKLPWVAVQALTALNSADQAAPAADDLVDLRIGAETVRPPMKLQAPPLVLDAETTRKSQFVLEESMRYLMRRFSAARFLVVYIPSPLVSYRLEADAVRVARPDGAGRIYSVSEIYRLSDSLCNRVMAIAQMLGSDFLDLRPDVRRESRDHRLHGPDDWDHFNRLGYEVMGRAIAGRLQQHGQQSACETLVP